eukprot:COSAG03_NODE_12139_length_559_cov_1.236957_1_plen_34_part_10
MAVGIGADNGVVVPERAGATPLHEVAVLRSEMSL